MLNKILCLCNVLYALNVEGMYYIIRRFIYSIDNFDQFIINVCERIKHKNVFYIKAIQAASSNNEVFSERVRKYMKIMADQVPYNNDEYDINNLKNILRTKNIVLSDKPIASGTISVVFKAFDDDKTYAIKYKRDNVDLHIKKSIEEMKFVITILNSMPYLNRMNLLTTFNENTKYIEEQLSFLDEWENINTVYKANKRDNRYLIPRPYYKDITENNNNIIIMEYLDGVGLEELSESDKDKFCEIVSKFGIKSIFFNGFVHGDLHQGNCKFIINNTVDYNADTDTDSEDESNFRPPREQLILYDFGILCKITKSEQAAMYNVLASAFNNNFKDSAKYMMNITQPEQVRNALSINDKLRLTDDLEYWCSDCVGDRKLIGPNDVHELSSILWKYNLTVSDWFCKIIFSFAVHESMAKALSVKKTFLEYSSDMIKESQEIFGMNTFKN
tara:strand:- start:378 stop:1712 length:1335 start_codon:yes stop_codon:yes gene_type:complete